MALKAYPKPYHEAYATFRALRRLGFERQEITVGFDCLVGVGHDMLYVQLRTQGTTVVLPAGELPRAAGDSAMMRWQQYCVEARRADTHALSRVLAGTSMRHRADLGVLVALLNRQGIVVSGQES